MQPKISIIIPIYNVEKYLADCLDSVLNQSFKDIEIIAVDDGGTDKSAEILKEYASCDNRIKIVNYNANKGLSYARNRGIEQASGKYVWFVDSDDMITEDSLSALYDKAEENKADAVMFDLKSIYEDDMNQSDIANFNPHTHDYPDIYTGQELFVRLKQNNDLQLMAPLFLWRKDFLIVNNLIFHEGILHEDNPFSICALLYARRVKFLKKTCYIYRRKAESITTKPTGIKNIRGVIAGNADVVRAATNYEGDIDKNFYVAIAKLLHETRRAMRNNLINMVKRGKDFGLYVENVLEIMELQSTINVGYTYISGVMDAFAYKKITDHKKIIVYGAGKIGFEVMRLLEEFGIKNYTLAVSERLADNYCGLSSQAVEIGNLTNDAKEAFVIVAVGKKLEDELVKKARELGFLDVAKATELFGLDDVKVKIGNLYGDVK